MSSLKGGGAINADRDAYHDNVYVNVNFINNTAFKGGALHGYGGSYRNSFVGCLFTNNSATNQSGAICYKIMQFNVFKNCSFIKNTANTTNGGALFVNGKFTDNIIGNVEFINNFAPKNGGAIYIAGTANNNLFENLTFSYNAAKGNDGGAINFHGELYNTRFNNIVFFCRR